MAVQAELLECYRESLVCDFVVYRIHVRRTDKVGAEAAFHSVEEYMAHVDDYYETLEKREHVDRRRVYIATDDPSVINDAKRKSVPVCYLPVLSSSSAFLSVLMSIEHVDVLYLLTLWRFLEC